MKRGVDGRASGRSGRHSMFRESAFAVGPSYGSRNGPGKPFLGEHRAFQEGAYAVTVKDHNSIMTGSASRCRKPAILGTGQVMYSE